MQIERRAAMLAGLSTLGLALANRTLAAPVLGAHPALTPAQAARRNAWLEIDASQFEANIAGVRALLGGGATDLCLIVKADAYGCGIDLLMPSILRSGARSIGVCANDEARIARAHGFRGRIIRVRTPLLEEIEDALPLGVQELIGNAEEARLLAETLRRRRSGRPLPIHLALNADGMSRNGLELKTEAARADARRILALPELRIIGLMTHYPTEDADDVRAQLARFNADASWLGANGLSLDGVTRHTANSAVTARFPAARLDMVRVGSFLYGDTEPEFPQFKGVMTLKSRVAAVNAYPAGETVNYDRTYRLGRDSLLANIPVGYSDGYRRGLTHANRPEFAAEGRNHTQVLVGGRRYPVVGRVTMNTLMVDVTDAEGRVRLGDEVVLFGRQGADAISQAEIETNGGVYGADFYTVLGNSVPKVLRAA
jgi:alanine racemase